MTDLHELTATRQVAAIARREVSSAELVAHYLDRIDRLDGDLRAFVTVFADQAMEDAVAADEATARGELHGDLHGLPLALKDLHAAAGMRTTFGSAVFADFVTPADAPAIANMRRAGAVIIGKTNAPEFGPTCYTDSAVGGTTINPYGHGLSPSGSSGGAAAAVAAGLVGIAHGSDGLGSIRTPAANCGLVGLKVTRGRLAGSGLDWMALQTEGPLARTVADAALILDVMGGAVDADLWRTPVPSPRAFRDAAQCEPVRPLRIGRLASPASDITVAPECLAGLDRGVELLSDAGHHIEDVLSESLPDRGPVRAAIKTVMASGLQLLVETLVGPEQRELLMPYTRWLVESETFTSVDLLRAHATIRAAALQYRGLLDGYDLVISPTTTAPPLPTAALRLDDADESFATMGRWSAFTPAANISGTPAISLPVHHTDDGLPIGVQLSGPANTDELLISVAAQMEQAAGWADRHPRAWTC